MSTEDDFFNTSTITLDTLTLDTLMGSIDLSATYITNGTAPLIAPYNSSPYITISDNSDSALKVNGDACFDGDIKIKGISLNETLKAIQDRLSILVPDPAKLEQFEALKKAYEHYKLLESLCDPNFKKEE